MNVLCCVPFHPLCGLTKYTVAGTVLGPASIVVMLAISPGVTQVLFSQGHQHRSTEVRSHDSSSCVPGPTVGAMVAAQTLAPSSPNVHLPTKSTVAKARPVPAVGAPVVYLDFLQVLNLQNRWQMCKSVACAAMGRDFSPAY